VKTTTPTYMGFNTETEFWGFSPSPIKGADYVWDISHWTFEQVVEFMNLPDDIERFTSLAVYGAKMVEFNS